MKRNLRFCGITGLVIIVFGLISWSLLAKDDFLVSSAHFGVGLVLIVVFLFSGGIAALRSKTAKRVAGFGAGLFVYSALFLVILFAANYFASKHKIFRYDSTEQNVYTLAPQTEQIIHSLKNPLEIRAFFLGGVIDEAKIKDLIERIKSESNLISLQIIDPEKSPHIVEKFKVTENRTLHFLLKTENGAKETKLSRAIAEQDIANALLRLTRTDVKSIYYITGHGEPSLEEEEQTGYSALRAAITDESYQLKELVLADIGNVPSDASAVILAAPQKKLLPAETKALQAYINSGGRALLLHSPNTSDDIIELAAPLGITVGRDVIVDKVVRVFEGPALGVSPMITQYHPHPVTKGFKQGILFGVSSSVTKAGNVSQGAKVTELAQTGENSWAEKKVSLIFSSEPQAALEEDDTKGPVSIAAAYEKKLSQTLSGADQNKQAIKESSDAEVRVVVFGDADFVSNGTIRQLFNKDFFLNALNWVIGEDAGVTIRSGTMRASRKGIDEDQFYLMFLFGAIIFPEIVVLLGLSIWWLRKN